MTTKLARRGWLGTQTSGEVQLCCAVLSHLVVSDSATSWTVAHQNSLSMGILQARILEWGTISFSRGSSWPRDQTHISCISCTGMVAQSCLTLCDPMDYTVHGILQTRILEWIAIPVSRGSSQPRHWTQVFHTEGGFFTSWATREAHFKR